MTPPTLLIDALSLRKGSRLLASARQLTLPRAAITLLVGSNGAGKTSLLRALHGLEPRDATVVSTDLTACRQAFVFQKPVFLRDSVRANLLLAARHAGRGKRLPDTGQLEALLSTVQLTGTLRRSAQSLSGGEQQRLALARALLTQPDLLLLDEPTSNLDTQATLQFESVLLGIRDAGCTVVMSSHSMSQVHRLAQGLVFMAKGEVLETHEPAQEFFKNPRTPEARDFLGQL